MYEAIRGLICGEVLDLQESQGRALTTPQKYGAVGSLHLEMGRDYASMDRLPFEMLYGRKCRTPICWREVGQMVMGITEVVLKKT